MSESMSNLWQGMLESNYYSNFLIHLTQDAEDSLKYDINKYAKAYHLKRLPHRRFEQCFFSISLPGPFSPERSIDVFFSQFEKVAEMYNTFKGVCVIDLSLYAANIKHPYIERLSEYLFTHRSEVIYFFIFTSPNVRNVRLLSQRLAQVIQINTISISSTIKSSVNVHIKHFLESIAQPNQSSEDKELLALIDELVDAAKYSIEEVENRIQNDILSEVTRCGQKANKNIKPILEQLIIRYKEQQMTTDTVTLGFAGGKGYDK